MLLKMNDSGDEVRELQRGLNKLGSIILVDGAFGPGTRDAVIDGRVALKQPGPPEADDALQQALAALPDPFPPLTPSGVTFIARAEVSSPRAYKTKYKNPIWPGGQSGVTIGIGYDLRFSDRSRFAADWGDHLAADTIERLSDVLRRKVPATSSPEFETSRFRCSPPSRCSWGAPCPTLSRRPARSILRCKT